MLLRFLWCSSSENTVFCVLKNRLFKNFGKLLGEHSYWSINQILPWIFFWKSLKSFLKLFSLVTASVCPSSSYSFKKICNIYIHTTYNMQVAILCIFYCFRVRKTKLDVDNNGKTRHNSTAWNGQFKIVSRSRPFYFWNYFFWALFSEISFSWNILYGIPSFCNLNRNPFFEKHDCPKKDVS